MNFNEAFKSKYDKIIALVLLETIRFGARKLSIIDDSVLAPKRVTLRYLRKLEQLGFIKLYYDEEEKDYFIIYNKKADEIIDYYKEYYRDLIEEIRRKVKIGAKKGYVNYKLLGYMPLLGYFDFVDDQDAVNALRLVISFVRFDE
ncbi:MAG: hypothetical protein F7C81_01890 [Desulfurococcales archaeon]|nr:hypothetical protein [Desulfurococcales archaeon]